MWRLATRDAAPSTQSGRMRRDVGGTIRGKALAIVDAESSRATQL